MRLERLSLGAFPKSVKEREKHLYEKMMATGPQSLVSQIKSAKSIASAFGMEKLTWESIKRLAASYDRTQKEPRPKVSRVSKASESEEIQVLRENFSAEPDRSVEDKPLGARRKAKVFQKNSYTRGKQYSRSRNRHECESSGSSSSHSDDGRLVCRWCNKPGHVEKDCWRKKGACLKCGLMGHYARACKKQSRSQARPSNSRRNRQRSGN